MTPTLKIEPPREGENWRRYTKREAKRLQVSRRRVVRAIAKANR